MERSIPMPKGTSQNKAQSVKKGPKRQNREKPVLPSTDLFTKRTEKLAGSTRVFHRVPILFEGLLGGNSTEHNGTKVIFLHHEYRLRTTGINYNGWDFVSKIDKQITHRLLEVFVLAKQALVLPCRPVSGKLLP